MDIVRIMHILNSHFVENPYSTPSHSTKKSMKSNLYILDDDQQYANLLAEVASNNGWNVHVENSPSEFLQIDLANGSVLVLDLIMPEMDGIEVIRELSKGTTEIFLILVSGFDTRVLHSAQKLAEAHNIKVLATLTKPIALPEFIKTLIKISATPIVEKKSTITNIPVQVSELERAIDQHQLLLYYQPQINMATGALEGVESLVRWQHPTRGLLFPDQFITLAEENNLIDKLTHEVISIAVEQSQKWKIQNLDIPISVNVSAENITSLSLPEQLLELTDKHTVVPENITLEITESAVMNKLTSSLDVLNRLRMKGFSLSIDDFGTGYSSLSHLYKAPFTELKVDQVFVMNMADDEEALIIVKICIMLGQMLGMKLVAEGVETKEIWDQLKQLGCDIAQGYYIAKPMPAEQLIAWRESWAIEA